MIMHILYQWFLLMILWRSMSTSLSLRALRGEFDTSCPYGDYDIVELRLSATRSSRELLLAHMVIMIMIFQRRVVYAFFKVK